MLNNIMTQEQKEEQLKPDLQTIPELARMTGNSEYYVGQFLRENGFKPKGVKGIKPAWDFNEFYSGLRFFEGSRRPGRQSNHRRHYEKR